MKISTPAFISKISLVLLLSASSCNKHENETAYRKMIDQSGSSISIENGKYRIDSSIIEKNANKRALLAALRFQKLDEYKTVAEIPGFIRAFFDSVSPDGKFDIADIDCDWRKGDIIDYCSQSSVCDRRRLPPRQFVYFGIGKTMALFSYYTGDYHLSQEITIIEFHNNKVTDFWFDRNADFVTSRSDIMEYLTTEKRSNGC